MILKLSWPQLQTLQDLFRNLKSADSVVKGELKDADNKTLLEWDEDEVKFTLPD